MEDGRKGVRVGKMALAHLAYCSTVLYIYIIYISVTVIQGRPLDDAGSEEAN
jgi:hypothetical protein